MNQPYSGVFARACFLSVAIAVGGAKAFAADAPVAAPAAAPGTAPAASTTASPTTAPSGRTFEAIMADFQASTAPLRQVINTRTLTDPTARAAAAPTAISAMKKANALGAELGGTTDQGRQIASQIQGQFTPFLLIFGDAETTSAMTAQAAGTDPKLAAEATRALLLADWVKSSSDVDQQVKLADSAADMAKADPTNVKLDQMLMMMAQLGPSNSALRDRMMDLAGSMNTPMAKQIQAMSQSEKKLKSLENKPLVIAGTTVDGKPFTTQDWKGKVILVDFWATWCGPCVGDLPRVKKAYTDFHAKGLEVLGISNDFDAKALTDFVAKDSAMPWPQLFDPKAAAAQEWNPITTGFGIEGIPTMFLIDKKGVVITIQARENFETEIPKLLAE